jgi:hypothetical protein
VVGAPNGVSKHRPFDRWFRYPAGFSESTLCAALEAAGGDRGLLVDCFAGSGSVGTAVQREDLAYVGIEAHPMVAELAALKFSCPGSPAHLIDFVADLELSPGPSGRSPTSQEADLVAKSFTSTTLATLVALRERIKERWEDPWAPYAKWALLGTLRDVATVNVGWPYQRPSRSRKPPHTDVVKRFRARAQMMADDLAQHPTASGSRVVFGDSRKSSTWRAALGDQQAAACVTSPPYLNNFDYADATRLEAYFWGAASTWAELCRDIRGDMLVATTQQTRRDSASHSADALEIYPKASTQILDVTSKLEVERLRRPRGKEYDRVVPCYFLGLARVLVSLYDRLADGSRAAWVVGDSAPYGIYVDTPGLVACLAEEVGFRTLEDRVVRARGQKWRTNGTRHQVALAERMVVFAKPSGRQISARASLRCDTVAHRG